MKIMKRFNAEWSRYKHFCILLNMPRYDEYDEHAYISIGIYKFFVTILLWQGTVKEYENYGDNEKYGFSFVDDSVLIYLGKRYYLIDMPWRWTYIRRDLLTTTGKLIHRNTDGFKLGSGYVSWHDIKETKVAEELYEEVIKDFRHNTKHGEQVADVVLHGEEWEWRRKWLTWFPYFGMIQRKVDINFSKDMGEKHYTSWKGGLVGCSSDWKHGETLTEAFYRWYEKWDGK